MMPMRFYSLFNRNPSDVDVFRRLTGSEPRVTSQGIRCGGASFKRGHSMPSETLRQVAQMHYAELNDRERSRMAQSSPESRKTLVDARLEMDCYFGTGMGLTTTCPTKASAPYRMRHLCLNMSTS